MSCEKVEIRKIILEEKNMTEELQEFIEANRDARELKRGVSVQMYLEGYKHREIKDILGVGSGYISKWTKIYVEQGLEGLLLGYQGKSGYLSEMQNEAINTWLQAKNYWNLVELQEYIEDEYNVVFESKQSYYAIFEKAGISWKKTQKHNPKGDLTIIQKKKDEITEWLAKHGDEIINEKLVIFFADECHLIPNHKREATDRASSMESLPTREAITDLVISERRFLTKSRNSSIFLGKENLNPCFKCSQTRSIGFNSGE